MTKLFEICACEEDLKILKGTKVIRVANYTDDNGNEGVHIDFEGSTGEIIMLSIADGAELHRSTSLQPLYCAQDIRNYIGYTISRVESDDNDLDSKVYLESADGDRVVVHTDKALDGETLFVENE